MLTRLWPLGPSHSRLQLLLIRSDTLGQLIAELSRWVFFAKDILGSALRLVLGARHAAKKILSIESMT